MFSARKMFLVLVAAFLIASCFNSAFGGVTGKVQGYVIDKRTQEGLPSVAVQIVGTTQGALTKPDGSYLILNVPPGQYSVTARLVGYGTMQVDEVKIITDRSTEVNIEMSAAAVETGIIQRVTAQKDIMEMKNPKSSVVISKEQMEVMPVQNVDDIIAATVGVVRHYGELHIRGGRSSEVSYIVDGVETKDPLGGLAPTDAGMNLSSNSIEEVQIIKGGFDPEYGNAMSGVVTVNTKTGTKTTEAYFEFFTDDLGAENLNKYSRDYDKLYFSVSGPEPLIAGRLLPALGVDYFKDKLFYFFSLDAGKSNTAYQYNKYASPANQLSFKEHDVLGLFTLKDRQNNSFSLQGNVVYEATNNVKFVFNYQGIWGDATIFSWYYRDTPSSAPVGNEAFERFSVTLTHQINKTTFYQFLVSRVFREYVRRPGDPNNPGVGMNPDQFRFESDYESFSDRNGNGTYDEPEPFINVYADTSYDYGGDMYTAGDVFIADTMANVGVNSFIYGWDHTRPYYLFDPWYSPDSIRWNGGDYPPDLIDTLLWDWNGDGLVSYSESEPFVDRNGNGRWDRGDQVLNDQNGNGRYDEELSSVAGNDTQEPYIDGDRNLGEPFHDYNNDGVYQEGIDRFDRAVDQIFNQDLNRNSRYDGPDAPWTPNVPFKDLNGNGVYDPPNNKYDPGEPFVDRNGNGKWDGTDGFIDRGYDASTGVNDGTQYLERSSEIYTADFKITKQLVREHEIKTGFQVKFQNLKYAYLKNPWIRNEVYDGGPWPDRGMDRDFYDHDPIEGAFFLQDVIEYGSLIARVGFRYDFFFQSGGVDELVEEYDQAGQLTISDRSKLSPRIGISYPITERAKIYFNYGHFYQLPLYVNMYRRLGFSTGIIGNPNLDYEKTVQYEFGVRQNLSGDYILDIAGFYKDIFGIINTQQVRFGVDLYQYANSDYGRTRGFEISIEKKYGDYVSGYASYTYAFAYGKASSELENYEALVDRREVPIQEFPLDWDIRHQVSLNFDLRITRSDHPKLFGYSIPNDWGMNVLWQFFTGRPFTPSPGFPGQSLESGERVLKNSMRNPSTSKVDFRFNKNFSFWDLEYSFELWIENLFDTENVVGVYSGTGREDTHNNANGIVRGDTDFYKNPTLIYPGRNIRLGFTVAF